MTTADEDMTPMCRPCLSGDTTKTQDGHSPTIILNLKKNLDSLLVPYAVLTSFIAIF